MTTVLDASALLAYLKEETGGKAVKAVLSKARISTVNWAEVVQKAIALGTDVDGMLEELQELGLKIEPFIIEDGEKAGRLWSETKQYGLSLGDRACLSLGSRLEATVLTSDRAWASLDIAVSVQVIR